MVSIDVFNSVLEFAQTIVLGTDLLDTLKRGYSRSSNVSSCMTESLNWLDRQLLNDCVKKKKIL